LCLRSCGLAESCEDEALPSRQVQTYADLFIAIVSRQCFHHPRCPSRVDLERQPASWLQNAPCIANNAPRRSETVRSTEESDGRLPLAHADGERRGLSVRDVRRLGQEQRRPLAEDRRKHRHAGEF